MACADVAMAKVKAATASNLIISLPPFFERALKAEGSLGATRLPRLPLGRGRVGQDVRGNGDERESQTRYGNLAGVARLRRAAVPCGPLMPKLRGYPAA